MNENIDWCHKDSMTLKDEIEPMAQDKNGNLYVSMEYFREKLSEYKSKLDKINEYIAQLPFEDLKPVELQVIQKIINEE